MEGKRAIEGVAPLVLGGNLRSASRAKWPEGGVFSGFLHGSLCRPPSRICRAAGGHLTASHGGEGESAGTSEPRKPRSPEPQRQVQSVCVPTGPGFEGSSDRPFGEACSLWTGREVFALCS
ncbi:hypothetical protein EYF80_051907 [Liparis tanakae]|uniref:Uncharacterized protein n=1 Tax=Liparis tanakae TaxID=230148 RepID=A0A4Z2FAM2_9TELE|nr:hypothetical protein EYF80_051907 [Liparis tanakae]